MNTLRDSDAAVAAIQRLQGINAAPARGNPLLDIPTNPDQPGYHDRINLTAAPDDEIEEIDLATGLPLNITQPPKMIHAPSFPGISVKPASDKRVLITFSRDPRNVIVSVVDAGLSHVYARAVVDGVSIVSLYPVLEAIAEIVDLAGMQEVFGAENGEDARPAAGGHRRGAESGAADSRRPDANPSEGAAPARGPAHRRSRGAADSPG